MKMKNQRLQGKQKIMKEEEKKTKITKQEKRKAKDHLGKR